jgi:hypothetical protein
MRFVCVSECVCGGGGEDGFGKYREHEGQARPVERANEPANDPTTKDTDPQFTRQMSCSTVRGEAGGGGRGEGAGRHESRRSALADECGPVV